MRTNLSVRHLPLLLAGLLICSCLGNRKVGVDATTVQLETPKPGAFPHDLMDKVQSAHVDAQGLVDYVALDAAPADLEKYVAYLQKYSPKANPELFPTQEEKLAYYMNAYNAFVIYGILQNYPGIASVNDVQVGGIKLKDGQGFFYSQKFQMGGEEINLYSLENDIIRKFNDPRIHAAINCASLGCPLLPQHAFHPGKLDQELDEVTRTYLAEKRNLKVDAATKTVYLSHIQDWYADDFKVYVAQKLSKPKDQVSVLEYNLLYTDGETKAAVEKALAEGYKLVFVDYDWGLNIKGAARPAVS